MEIKGDGCFGRNSGVICCILWLFLEFICCICVMSYVVVYVILCMSIVIHILVCIYESLCLSNMIVFNMHINSWLFDFSVSV